MIYYFKYRELSDIFTVNDQISDNSIQINYITFTFTLQIQLQLLYMNI